MAKRGRKNGKVKTSVAEAKALIEADKEKRITSAKKEIEAVCEKHNVDIRLFMQITSREV